MNREQHTLSPADNKRIFDEAIVPSLYNSITPTENPKALFFRGQPGSGKSIARTNILDDLRLKDGDNSVTVIDIDGFRRFHPQYATLQATDEARAAFYTDLDCGAWTEHAINHSMTHGSHVALEGTLRNEGPTLQTAHEYTQHGIHPELYLLAVNELTSRYRIFQRYIEQLRDSGRGRYTLPDAHDVAYVALPETAHRTVQSGLFEQVHIIGQQGYVVDSIDGRGAESADKVTARLNQVRQLSLADISTVEAMTMELWPDIHHQDSPAIRRDFERLTRELRQLSTCALGGLSIAASGEATA